MKQTTTLAPQRRPGLQTLKSALQRLTMTLMLVMLTAMTAWAEEYNLGNCWHVPAAAEPTGTYMRNPIHPYASLDVTIYNGNQAYEYEGENPGNPGDQSGGTIYYRAAGATAWQTVPMECDTEIENNKYWRGTIPADEFAEGNTVEYVIKVTYNEHDDTYLGLAAKGETASTAFGTMAEAEAHPFSFKYLTPNTVDYIDENGQTQTVTATLLTDDLLNSDLGIDGATTWYVVNSTFTHSGKITCRGNVNLILADGKKLTTSNGKYAIYGDNGTLTIYGQTNGTGTLEAICSGDIGIYHLGNVTICGGTVNATSNIDAISAKGSVTICGGTVNTNGNAGINGSSGVTINGGTVTATATMLGIGGSSGSITITGGTVNATGQTGIWGKGGVTINGGTVNANGQTGIRGNGGVTINGGQVTATATNGGQGIISLGNITLGWTSADDFIRADSYYAYSTVNIADGQAFHNGSEVLSGTIDESDYATKLYGKTLTPDLSYAPDITVSYVKADGTTDTHQATVLTGGGETTLYAGWYVVISNITYTGTISLGDGEVTIILANGKTMNIGTSESPVTGNGINGLDYGLTIYGQTLDEGTAGQLRIYTSSNNTSAGILSKTYTQHSGNVTINSYGNNALAGSNITINGGKLDATASTGWQWAFSNDVIALAGSNITINGGIVNATGIQYNDAHSADGIYCTTTLTLGWTKATDQIYASSYDGTVTIAPGYAFHNGSEVLSGTIDESDYATKLNGQTLVPYGMTLAAKEATVNDETNYWTTYYCGDAGLAIDATENACAYTATVSGETITLHRLGKVIPAGTAVIIVGEDASIGMTVSTAPAEQSPENDLHGLDIATPLNTVKSTYGADAILMLSNKNDKFGFHDVALTNIPARKAFLALSGEAAKARQFTMVFDGETGIRSLTPDPSPKGEGSDYWYTLDGRRIANGQKPTAKGLYIVNGKKVIIK